MTGIPFHPEPWTQIHPLLYMGGHFHLDHGVLRDTIVGHEFGLVLSLYSRHGHGPGLAVPRRYINIPDGILTPEQLDNVRALADIAAATVEAGRSVLARCQAGYNRSGLLTALTLLKLGHTADEAIGVIRLRRGPYALSNTHFVDLIHAEHAALNGDDQRAAAAG